MYRQSYGSILNQYKKTNTYIHGWLHHGLKRRPNTKTNFTELEHQFIFHGSPGVGHISICYCTTSIPTETHKHTLNWVRRLIFGIHTGSPLIVILTHTHFRLNPGGDPKVGEHQIPIFGHIAEGVFSQCVKTGVQEISGGQHTCRDCASMCKAKRDRVYKLVYRQLRSGRIIITGS